MRSLKMFFLSATLAVGCQPAGEDASVQEPQRGNGGSGGAAGGSASGGEGGSGGQAGGAAGSVEGAAGSGGVGGSAGQAGAGAGGTAGTSAGGSGGAGALQPDAAADAATAPGDAGADAGPSGALPGMTVLFDGTNFEQWVYDPAAWSIKDGAMHGKSPRGQSQAFTKESYSSFRLIVSSRMVRSNDHLGVCLWGGRPAAGRYGFERCLLVIPPHGAIWDYLDNSDHPKPKDFNQNEWHRTEILANRQTGKVLVATDGKLVHEYQDPAGQLARRQNGPIGMQIHRAGEPEVQYKDISVEVDPKEDRLLTLTP